MYKLLKQEHCDGEK